MAFGSTKAAPPIQTPPIRAQVAVYAITPQEALAAANLSGAVTDVPPGLTARQAVGLDAIPTNVASQLGLVTGSATTSLATGSATTAASTIDCWTTNPSHQWSIWPAEEILYDLVSWCGYYNGSITYRSQTPHQDGTLCQPNGTWSQTVYWYAGSPLWEIAVGGYWNCGVGNVSQSMTTYVSGSGSAWIGWWS